MAACGGSWYYEIDTFGTTLCLKIELSTCLQLQFRETRGLSDKKLLQALFIIILPTQKAHFPKTFELFTVDMFKPGIMYLLKLTL